MKLKEEFVTVLNKDSSITVSTDTKLFSGMIRGNETAAFMMKCLEKETSVDEIVAAVLHEYEADETLVRKDVEDLISKLRSVNAIDEG